MPLCQHLFNYTMFVPVEILRRLMLALIVVRATYIINQIKVNNFAFSLVTHDKGTFALRQGGALKGIPNMLRMLLRTTSTTQ